MEGNFNSDELAEIHTADITVEKPKPKNKITRKTLFVLLMMASLSSMGFTILSPILPFIVDKNISNPDDLASAVGWLSSVYAICQFLATPALLGILSDRYGRRPILLICLSGSILGYLLFGVGGAFWLLIVSRIIDGLTGGNYKCLNRLYCGCDQAGRTW